MDRSIGCYGPNTTSLKPDVVQESSNRDNDAGVGELCGQGSSDQGTCHEHRHAGLPVEISKLLPTERRVRARVESYSEEWESPLYESLVSIIARLAVPDLHESSAGDPCDHWGSLVH